MLRKISGVDRAALFFATGCGVGYIPSAPGTFGSIAALLPIAALMQGPPWLFLITAMVITFVGVPVCDRGARALNLKDPGSVVLDEVAGMFWTFIPTMLAVGGGLTWGRALAGFLLFRLLDITKPSPVRNVEKLPGGWGIMADDVLAGMVAGNILWGLLYLLKNIFK